VDFSPGSASLKCPYCSHETPIPQSEEEIQELDFHSYLQNASQEEEQAEVTTVKCETCGAESSLDPSVTSEECPFCGANIVTESQSTRLIRPKSLLPFKVTLQQANDAFRSWLKGLWFAPNKLKTFAQSTERLKGVYVPYWTYDCSTTCYYRGERGEHYYETETYETEEDGETVTKTRQVRRTRWHSVSGVVWNWFDDVLVLASETLPRRNTEELEPWDLENLVPFGDEYLSGFRAESYQVDLAEGFERAKKIMQPEITDTVGDDIGGDEQRIHSMRVRHDNVSFKHILLPIWISAYRYQDRAYRFLINGRTGEVQGERPYSWIKITLTALAAAAAIAAAWYFLVG